MFWLLASSLGVPVFVAAVLAVILTMVLSLLSEVVVYRPLRKKKTSLNVIMIASIGLMTVIINLIAMAFGNETKVIESSILKTFSFGEVIITTPQLYQIIVSVVAIAAFLILIDRTKLAFGSGR